MGFKKRKTIKIMKIDGTTYRQKTPVQAGDILRAHPGHDLLESEEVKQKSLRAQPLHPDHPLQPGKLYFLVELPKLPRHGGAGPPRRAWSGALHVSAKDRLESLKLSRRSVSDLTIMNTGTGTGTGTDNEGMTRIKMRLRKEDVMRVMEGSTDSMEAAEKIMKLCLDKEVPQPPPVENRPRTEKRTRFLPMVEEITA